MTTIAYRDGVLASDSSCWEGDIKTCSVRKIFRVRGALVGFTGNLNHGMRFLDWVRDGAHHDEIPRGNYTGIVVSKSGSVTTYDNGEAAVILRGKYFAFGNGQDVALGAMHAGANARRAVMAAIEHSAKTDGPIRILRIKHD